jgi:hypothetical protein
MWSNGPMDAKLPLLFDRQAAAAQPSTTAVRAWAGAQRVFVSSLITDLHAERDAARVAIQSVGALPVMFERDLGAQDVPADRAYLDGVRESRIYVGIFGPRYGVRLESGRSATHDELAEAERLGLRLCLFTSGYGSAVMDRDQRDVIDGLRNLYTTSSYTNPDDLRERLEQRLTDIAAEEILPWVRIGRLLVRAGSISSSGETIAVTATVSDRSILAELKLLDQRRETVPFATHLDAFDVQVQQVASSITTATTTDVTVTLQRRRSQGSSGVGRMHVNGISPDDIVTWSLSDGMLGTSLLPNERFGGLWRAENPLSALAGLGVPERSLRPIAQVLLTEFLIRNDHASAVEPLDLGPSHQGSRAMKLTWRPPRQYSNSPESTPITLKGQIRGV